MLRTTVQFVFYTRLSDISKQVTHLASLAVNNCDVGVVTFQPAVNTLTERLDEF